MGKRTGAEEEAAGGGRQGDRCLDARYPRGSYHKGVGARRRGETLLRDHRSGGRGRSEADCVRSSGVLWFGRFGGTACAGACEFEDEEVDGVSFPWYGHVC